MLVSRPPKKGSIEELVAAAIVSAKEVNGTSEKNICAFVEARGGDARAVPLTIQRMLIREELDVGSNGFIYIKGMQARGELLEETPKKFACDMLFEHLRKHITSVSSTRGSAAGCVVCGAKTYHMCSICEESMCPMNKGSCILSFHMKGLLPRQHVATRRIFSELAGDWPSLRRPPSSSKDQEKAVQAL